MANPVFVINNSTGSNTQASGAGPGDGTTGGSALFGSDGGATNGFRFGLWDGDSLDLSNVATDGSHVLYVPASTGRRFTRILGVKNTVQSFTGNATASSAVITNVSSTAGLSVGDFVDTDSLTFSGQITAIDAGAGTVTLSEVAGSTLAGADFKCPKQVTTEESFNITSGYAIGGKRKDFETTNTHTKLLFGSANFKAGWIGHLEYTGTAYAQSSGAFAFSASGDLTSGFCKLIGTGGMPEITCATNGGNIIALAGSDYWEFNNIRFTHTGATRGAAIANTTSASTDIKVNGCIFDGLNAPMSTGSSWNRVAVKGSEIKNCTSTTVALFNVPGSTFELIGNDIHDNANPSVLSTAATTATNWFVKDNLWYDNSGSFLTQTSTTSALHRWKVLSNVLYGGTDSTIKIAGNTATVGEEFHIQNNIFYGNASVPYAIDLTNISDAERSKMLFPCNRSNAYGNQATAARRNVAAGTNEKTLTADPFVDAASGNFALNAAAGGGALLDGERFPKSFPAGLTTSQGRIGVA